MPSTELTYTIEDDNLLTLAANGKSADEMEKATGIPAAEALARVKKMLRDQDAFTLLERKKLLLHSAYSLKAKLEGDLDLSNAIEVANYLRVLKTVGEQLDKQSTLTAEELEKVTKVQAMRLLELLTVAVDHAKNVLASSSPNADIEQIETALRSGLRVAALEVEQ